MRGDGVNNIDSAKESPFLVMLQVALWGKSGIDTAGFWSRWLLWNKPTIKESYDDIKRRFL
jgi:hypothetical protein